MSKMWKCFMRIVSTLREGFAFVKRGMLCRLTKTVSFRVVSSKPQVRYIWAEPEPNVWLLDCGLDVGSKKAFALCAMMKLAWEPESDIARNRTCGPLAWWTNIRAVDNRTVMTVPCVLKCRVVNLLVGSTVSEFMRELFRYEEFPFFNTTGWYNVTLVGTV